MKMRNICMTMFLLATVFTLQVSVSRAQNRAMDTTIKSKWIPLFDGKSLNGWRGYRQQVTDAWDIEDGAIHNKGNADTTLKHADLTTDSVFGSFQLNIDWKIDPKANSGILYLVNEAYPAAHQSGPEFQLIDDKGYPAKLENWQKTGANYAMEAPLVDAAKPAGEWNQTIIIVDRGKVEHWLNGKKVADYVIGSDTWNTQKWNGKWKDTPSYGIAKEGHIVLQDHGGMVWFKNILIRKLD